ncbi:MAG: hypothetical protein PHR92_10140 [Lachnospiraceae bacterium]|nr:hypothetical protein [Lachnospiraceae bacterium]
MKKILLWMLSFCLFGSMTAMADNVITDTAADKTASTTVSTTVEAAYSVVIPASVPITYGAISSDLLLSVTAFRLAPKQVIRVSASSGGTLKNSVDPTKIIAYQIKQGNAVFQSTDFKGVGKQKLTVEITSAAWNTAAAGTYTDMVTFTVSTPVLEN